MILVAILWSSVLSLISYSISLTVVTVIIMYKGESERGLSIISIATKIIHYLVPSTA